MKVAVAKIEPFQESLFTLNFLKIQPEVQSLQIFAAEDLEELIEEIQLKDKLSYVDTDIENELVVDYQNFFCSDYLGENSQL